MVSHKPEYLAKEAERLLRDDVLAAAINAMRAEALEELAACHAPDVHAVQKLQARVAACDDLSTQLQRYIVALGNSSDDE